MDKRFLANNKKTAGSFHGQEKKQLRQGKAEK
jgi:hypothetical protein